MSGLILGKLLYEFRMPYLMLAIPADIYGVVLSIINWRHYNGNFGASFSFVGLLGGMTLISGDLR